MGGDYTAAEYAITHQLYSWEHGVTQLPQKELHAHLVPDGMLADADDKAIEGDNGAGPALDHGQLQLVALAPMLQLPGKHARLHDSTGCELETRDICQQRAVSLRLLTQRRCC